MALKIRLSRGGTKKRPFYRIVVADSRFPRDGRFIERVGTYNPLLPDNHETRVTLKEERIRYWLGIGAKATDRVQRLMSKAGIVAAPAIPQQTKKNQPRSKTLERMKAAEEAAKAAETKPVSVEKDSSQEPSETTSVAEEATTEEPATEAAPSEEATTEEPATEAAPSEEATTDEPATDGAASDDTPATGNGTGEEEK